ncbi:hypothetical protein WEH80_25945 [Actinomycetes bacterium KLBMP 9759]
MTTGNGVPPGDRDPDRSTYVVLGVVDEAGAQDLGAVVVDTPQTSPPRRG